MALGSTESLTEMSTRNLPAGKERPAREADKLTAMWVHGLLQGQLYLKIFNVTNSITAK
jgi:hypothetical protein